MDNSLLTVGDNLEAVRNNLPEGVRLVAISKYHPADYLQEAYNRGQRIFGESHEQELRQKVDVMPTDIEWHFIGHLQSNKVKYIAPYIDMIEAVDTLKLMREINKQAERHNRVIDILIELHIAGEETKYGFTPDDCREMISAGEWREMKNVRICGLMMMASNTPDEGQIRKEMNTAWELFCELKRDYFADAPYFKERSWGMSHDYKIAIECHSTMVRVGTAIFGPRVY